MVTFAEAAATLDGLLRPVPPVGPGICRVCHHVPSPGFDDCWSCGTTMGQVSMPVQHVVPITIYETRGQVWHHLRQYKDSPDPATRKQLRIPLLAVLARFLTRHGDCVAPGGWDLITCVPSTRRTETQHPLLRGMRRVRSLQESVADLLEPGPTALGHNQADDRGYVVSEPGSERVLLVDDTFTTGARLQSAASALSLAGHEVAGAVVIGRVFTPDWSADHQRVWDDCCARPFDPTMCVECDEHW